VQTSLKNLLQLAGGYRNIVQCVTVAEAEAAITAIAQDKNRYIGGLVLDREMPFGDPLRDNDPSHQGTADSARAIVESLQANSVSTIVIGYGTNPMSEAELGIVPNGPITYVEVGKGGQPQMILNNLPRRP